MGLHASTIEKLEDIALCKTVINAINNNYSKNYIQRIYGLSRRELERIIEKKVTIIEN